MKIQLSAILALSTALLGASISALATKTSQLGIIEAKGATYHGEVAVKRALMQR